MIQTRSMSREIGTAFAVLAIYLLTVLAPLHHARASQLAFDELGYASTEIGWVLCTPADPRGDTGDTDDVRVAKCPATAVGKLDFTAPVPNALTLDVDMVALAAPRFVPSFAPLPAAATPPGGSRAPPALV